MIVDCVERPVTFRAVQHVTNTEVSEFEEILEGTRVSVVERRSSLVIQFPPPPYHTHGYVENGPSETLWLYHWVVVSSLGKVRVMSDEEFTEEFAVR